MCKEIIITCQVLQELGHEILSLILYTISYGSNPFKDGVPGPDWWQGFLQRWTKLTEKTSTPFCQANQSNLEELV